jgi:hypothetical protein
MVAALIGDCRILARWGGGEWGGGRCLARRRRGGGDRAHRGQVRGVTRGPHNQTYTHPFNLIDCLDP